MTMPGQTTNASPGADPLTWTADQLTTAVKNSIKLRDWDALNALLKILAVKHPHRARDVLDTLELGLVLAGGGRRRFTR